jgi:GBP family porin
MKKTLIAAALLAGFAGAAQAETSVTLYGIVDLGVAYQRVKGMSEGGVLNGTGDHQSKIGLASGNQNGSRWGLRGTEDLGDGLRAVFTLEGGFTANDGKMAQGSRLFGRQSTVGLASDSWGQVDFGRQTNIASKYVGAIDPFGEAFGQSEMGHAFSASNTQRYDNMIQYNSANYSGFQAGAGYSFNTGTDANPGFQTDHNQRAITAGVRYVNGPINIAASYDQLNPAEQNKAASGGSKAKEWIIAGSYDFEVVKLALAYGQTKDGWFAGQGTSPVSGNGLSGANSDPYRTNSVVDNSKVKSYLVGLTAPIGGSSSVFGSWQRADPNNSNLTGDDQTMNTYSVGYTYDLSKRTNLYAYASYSKNFAFLDDVTSTVGVVGIRHRF